jgi:isopentenyl-diphosphate delta-isomerase
MEKIIIVNEEDEIIGYKERDTLTADDIYRVSGLWIENNKGQVLLARRAFNKKKDPGMWGPAVAGTIDKGETYESNIIKEANEELGLQNIKLNKGPKKRIKHPHNHFTQWFLLKLNKPLEYFKINKEEVAEIKWFDKDELINLAKKDDPTLIKSLKQFILSSIK